MAHNLKVQQARCPKNELGIGETRCLEHKEYVSHVSDKDQLRAAEVVKLLLKNQKNIYLR